MVGSYLTISLSTISLVFKILLATWHFIIHQYFKIFLLMGSNKYVAMKIANLSYMLSSKIL